MRLPALSLALLAACNSPTLDDLLETDETDVETDETEVETDADPDTDETDAGTDDTDETDADDTDVACPDGDGDGVCDDDDQCLGNDAIGDDDLDGLCEDRDLCAGDDSFGDVDGDFVCDNIDPCEGDNFTGDSDSDGVCNDRDACTGGDASGDSDSDGVCDDTDVCTGDDAVGDSDLDGVCDDVDLCWGDDASGDTDSDGTCDDLDRCPGGSEDDLDGSGEPDACEPVELARLAVPSASSGSTLGQLPFATLLLEASSCPFAPTVGRSVALADGETGTFSLDSGNEADFAAFVTCLTNGDADSFVRWSAVSNGPGQAFATAGGTWTESALGFTPDLAGYAVTRIELVITQNEVSYPAAGQTSLVQAGEWVFYGYERP